MKEPKTRTLQMKVSSVMNIIVIIVNLNELAIAASDTAILWRQARHILPLPLLDTHWLTSIDLVYKMQYKRRPWTPWIKLVSKLYS